jgi:hypothetical protein
MGAGVGEEVAFDDAEEVGVGVTVRLNTVGTTVVIGMFWFPEGFTVVTVTLLVVSTRETVLAGDGEED